MKKHGHSNGRIWLGSFLIISGFLLFMNNFHLTFFSINIFSWPILFVIIGIMIFINHKDSGFAFILIIAGILGLTSDILNISLKATLYEYWPFLIILFGLFLIFKKNVKPNKYNSDFIEKDEHFVDIFSVVGDSRKKINIKNFLGGKVTSIFCDLKIDLKDSDMDSGVKELDTITIFGATEFIIPSNWQVIIKVTTLFGGFEDRRIFAVEKDSDEKKVLVIKGIVLFGSGKIKN